MSILLVNLERFVCSGSEKVRGTWTDPDMLSLSAIGIVENAHRIWNHATRHGGFINAS